MRWVERDLSAWCGVGLSRVSASPTRVMRVFDAPVRHPSRLGLKHKCVRKVRSREVTASQAGGGEPPRRAVNLMAPIGR